MTTKNDIEVDDIRSIPTYRAAYSDRTALWATALSTNMSGCLFIASRMALIWYRRCHRHSLDTSMLETRDISARREFHHYAAPQTSFRNSGALRGDCGRYCGHGRF